MKKHVLRRSVAVLLTAAMVVTLLAYAGLSGKAQAATATKTVACLGTSVIKAPTAPADVNKSWTGSYVWYGKYNGIPVKYRVLAPKTTIYGGTTMLLDCDSILYSAQFSGNEDNCWNLSDVKAGLNGSSFLTKAYPGIPAMRARSRA